jgi:hypothetical protein
MASSESKKVMKTPPRSPSPVKSPVRSPIKSPAKLPLVAEEEQFDPDKCYGGNKDELVNKKVAELKELLKDAGIKNALPTKKADMIEYLCNIVQNIRCDPEQGIHCEHTMLGETCDITNTPGVCMSEGQGFDRIARAKLESMMVDGKKIIGTKSAIERLKNILLKPEETKPTTPTTPPETPPETPPTPKQPTPKQPTPKPPRPSKPLEGEEVVEIDDIEEILKQIQQGGGAEIGELAATQTAVLKCLGLLA